METCPGLLDREREGNFFPKRMNEAFIELASTVEEVVPSAADPGPEADGAYWRRSERYG